METKQSPLIGAIWGAVAWGWGWRGQGGELSWKLRGEAVLPIKGMRTRWGEPLPACRGATEGSWGLAVHCSLPLPPRVSPTLGDPMDCSLPGSSVHGILQARNTGVGCHSLHQGIFPTQGSNPGLPHCRRILYCLSHQGRSILAQLSFRKPLQISTYKEKKLKKWCCCLVTKSCPTLCNSMDCSPLGSSVHGILQARILEWVAIPFTRASS